MRLALVVMVLLLVLLLAGCVLAERLIMTVLRVSLLLLEGQRVTVGAPGRVLGWLAWSVHVGSTAQALAAGHRLGVA